MIFSLAETIVKVEKKQKNQEDICPTLFCHDENKKQKKKKNNNNNKQTAAKRKIIFIFGIRAKKYPIINTYPNWLSSREKIRKQKENKDADAVFCSN